jgi:hypothetical protein
LEFNEAGVPLPPPQPDRRRMLTRSQAMNLVEALNEAGFSCSLNASPTPTGSREYELAIRFDSLGMGQLTSLIGVMERFPDARLVLKSGRILIA